MSSIRKVVESNTFPPNWAWSWPGFGLNNLGLFESGEQSLSPQRHRTRFPCGCLWYADSGPKPWVQPTCDFFGLSRVLRKLGNLEKKSRILSSKRTWKYSVRIPACPSYQCKCCLWPLLFPNAVIELWLQFIITLVLLLWIESQAGSTSCVKKRVFLREKWGVKKPLTLGHLPAPVVIWRGDPPVDIGEVMLRVSQGITEPKENRYHSTGPGWMRLRGGWNCSSTTCIPLSSSHKFWGGLYPGEKLSQPERLGDAMETNGPQISMS